MNGGQSQKAERLAPDEIDERDLYGRLARQITPEQRARAAAEWEAMDENGRLPKGWKWRAGK